MSLVSTLELSNTSTDIASYSLTDVKKKRFLQGSLTINLLILVRSGTEHQKAGIDIFEQT